MSHEVVERVALPCKGGGPHDGGYIYASRIRLSDGGWDWHERIVEYKGHYYELTWHPDTGLVTHWQWRGWVRPKS